MSKEVWSGNDLVKSAKQYLDLRDEAEDGLDNIGSRILTLELDKLLDFLGAVASISMDQCVKRGSGKCPVYEPVEALYHGNLPSFVIATELIRTGRVNTNACTRSFCLFNKIEVSPKCQE